MREVDANYFPRMRCDDFQNTTRARANAYVVQTFLKRQYIGKRAFDGPVVDM